VSDREPSSVWDRPVTNAELDQFYGVDLSDMAIEIGEQHVLENMELISEFLVECSPDREPCAYFGPIATAELVWQILLNKEANESQLAAAARELRARILRHFDKTVKQRASEVMNG
jgi:hypothetical protein